MDQQFITEQGDRLSISRQQSHRLGRGGQGQVYRSTLSGRSVAVKLLQQADPQRLQALQQLAPSCADHATLPLAVLYHSRHGVQGDAAGYVMTCMQPESSLSLARLFNFDELQRLQRFTWADALLAAQLLAEAVAALHAAGVVIGDLNPENILFTRTQDALRWRAVLLDTDSFQICSMQGQRFYCNVARPLYTAPELIDCDLSQTWRDRSSDWFSLAVLIYQILLHDHPFDNAINTKDPDLAISEKIRRGLYPHGLNCPDWLRPGPARPAPREVCNPLADMFLQSFCTEPKRRPSAQDWVLLLRQLHTQVVPCQRIPQHHHVQGQACHWCAVEQRLGLAICRFPIANAPGPAVQASPAVQWEALARSLKDVFSCHHQRANDLILRRDAAATQLAAVEQELETLLNTHGGSGHWLDQARLHRQLTSVRLRLKDWIMYRRSSAARRSATEQLLQLVRFNCDLVHDGYRTLQRQRLDLQQQLNGIDLSSLIVLTASHDSVLVAESRLAKLAAVHREQWLHDQLSRESLRSWQIEGFGDRRLRLLESHGVFNGNQLRDHIDRIQGLPGIGAGLQQRLRSHLAKVTRRLEAGAVGNAFKPTHDDLLPQSELAALQIVEDQLLGISRGLECLVAELSALQRTIVRQRDDLAIALQAFETLYE